MRLRLAIALLGCYASLAQQGPGPELRDAIAALQRSDFAAAEKLLRAEVAAHPDSAWAWSLLGAALDSVHRPAEADVPHRRAVAIAPRSAEILNNFATHLWMAGNQVEAAKVYEQIVAIEPAHLNANLQLARNALARKDTRTALRALDRLPKEAQASPQGELFRLEALYESGDSAGAEPLFAGIAEKAKTDAGLALAAGLALSNSGQFARAESMLDIGLRSAPADFGLLYNLGIAATRAGHLERARDVLGAAVRQQPRNADALYALAFVEYGSRDYEAAVQSLSRAASIEPRRADVQRLLALATTDLGALEDAAAAWDRYITLAPKDDTARRERGYTAFQRGHVEEGIADLEWFAAKHPSDATGHYELGQAERSRNLEKAMREFDRALEIDADYVPALTARAALKNQQGKAEEALKDLEKAARLRPDDAGALDRLGQTYASLDRPADAVRTLRRAAELAPADSKTLLHYARALADSGDLEQSKAVMERFRQLGPEKKAGVPAGFVEYLTRSEEERQADYRARLEKALREKPADAGLRVERVKLLLREGLAAEAETEARGIAEMRADPAILVDAGRALLAAGRFAAAADLLRQSGAGGLDLTIAERLAEGKCEDAIRAAPERADVYRHAAALLAAQRRPGDAFEVLGRAAERFPRDREILLRRGIAAELAGRRDVADRALEDLRAQWPEWNAAWAAQGMILARRGELEPARRFLETAMALGASGSEVYYYVARSAGDRETAEAAIAQARRLAPKDPWINGGAGDPPYLERLLR